MQPEDCAAAAPAPPMEIGNAPASAHRAEWGVLLFAAMILLSVRLPFLPPTLDDIDAFNFDLGVHDYNPAAFRPHPPGYPVFILLAKLSHAVFVPHATALAFVSVLFSTLTLVPLYFLVREFSSRTGAALACILTLMSPLIWFNSVRPMSDATGLFAVLAAQCLLVRGLRMRDAEAPGARRLWLLGVVVSGLAFGVRAQTFLLLGPVLVYGCVRAKELRVRTAVWLAVAVTAWMVPALMASGGPAAYFRSLSLLFANALPAEPLLSAPSVHRAAYALWDVLGAAWGPPWLGVPVVMLAGAGALRLAVSNRAALAWALLLFLPYALYHYLLQMTATIRYAMPVVPLLAFVIAVPLANTRGRWRSPMLATVAVAFVALTCASTWPALLAYHTTTSPGAEALARVRSYAPPAEFVVAGNHVFERHLSTLPPAFAVLRSEPRRPWKPLSRYWKGGGRKPILFFKNPDRTTLLLVGRDTQTTLGSWSWPPPVERLMKGERPLAVELVRLDPPEWFIESGLLASADAGLPQDVAREHHLFHIRPSQKRRLLIASGILPRQRNANIALRVGDSVHDRWTVEKQFSIRSRFGELAGPGYLPVSFESSEPLLFTDLMVADEGHPVIRPGAGFYPAETGGRGRRFRWMAPQATAEAFLSSQWGQLRIRGRIPAKYYDGPVTMSLDWNGTPLGSVQIRAPRFVLTCRAPAGEAPWSTLTIRSSHSFIPGERQKNGDTRVLAAQVDQLRLTTAPDAFPAGCVLR